MSEAPRVGRRAWVAAAIGFAFFGLVQQRELARAPGSHVYAQDVPGNDSLLLTWSIAWDQHALATDPAHVLDANIFYPHHRTLLYSEHVIGLAVLLAPFRLVTDNPVLVHNVVILAAPALNALAMFALVAELTAVPGAAFVAGLAYGFAPIRMNIDRCNAAMLTAWWLPLLLLGVHQALARRRRRGAVIAGGALLFQGLTGVYHLLLVAPFLALAHVAWVRSYPLRTHRREWRDLLTAEGAAVLLLAPLFLAYRSVQTELGVTRSPVVNALLALPLIRIETLVPAVSLAALGLAAIVWRRDAPPRARPEIPVFFMGALVAFALALGPAVTLPGGGSVWGPYAWVVSLPGFSALRAPGRLVHVVLLCLSVLAGIGLAALLRRRRPTVRRTLVLVAAGVVVCEAWLRPYPTVRVPQPRDVDAVADWLARAPSTTRYAELPIDYLLGSTMQQYASIAHFRSTLTGNMGLLPPVFPYLVRRLERFPASDVVGELASLGFTHVVAFTQRLDATRAQTLRTATADPTTPVDLVWTHGGTHVYALRGTPALPSVPPGAPLDRAMWQVSASPDADDAPHALGDDPQTAWTSYGDLERGLRHWYDPRSFPQRYAAFASSGPVWLAVDLGHPATVGAVVLRMDGSDPLAAPTLALERSDDGITWTAVPSLLQAVPDVRALVAAAATPRFALVPAAPVATRHVRVTAAALEWRVSDLRVWATSDEAP